MKPGVYLARVGEFWIGFFVLILYYPFFSCHVSRNEVLRMALSLIGNSLYLGLELEAGSAP